jgi:hypothetical protein
VVNSSGEAVPKVPKQLNYTNKLGENVQSNRLFLLSCSGIAKNVSNANFFPAIESDHKTA